MKMHSKVDKFNLFGINLILFCNKFPRILQIINRILIKGSFFLSFGHLFIHYVNDKVVLLLTYIKNLKLPHIYIYQFILAYITVLDLIIARLSFQTHFLCSFLLIF
jgi:hypothetical protein